MSLLLALLSFVKNEHSQTRRQCYAIPVWLPDRGREAHGRWFPPRTKFVFTFGANSSSRIMLVGEILPGSFAVSWGAVAFIPQWNCSIYCALHLLLLPPSISFLSHSFTVCTYAQYLSLARPLTPYTQTHLTHALFLKVATPLLQQQIGLL